MARDWRGDEGGGGDGQHGERTATAPGKRTRTEGIVQLSTALGGAGVPGTDRPSPPADPPAPPVDPFDWTFVQLTGGGGANAATVQAHAADGVDTPSTSLPFHHELTAAFGPAHDLGGVRAHVGGDAEQSARAMGATAYATGQDVVLPENPSLHLVAHEVTHVVQQRDGVQLAGGVGAAGDPYEQQADAVADAVVRGEHVGDRFADGGGGGAAAPVQRKDDADAPTLWAWVEPMLKGFLSIPVRKGDAVAAKTRVDLIMGTVKALHRAQRKILFARLSEPKGGDELAELFSHQLHRATRKRILAALRDGGAAATEEPEEAEADEKADARPGAEPTEAPVAEPDGRTVANAGTGAAGADAMWKQIVGEKSEEVGKLARVRAPKGLRLRTRPAPGEPDIGIMEFNELVQVERRTAHGWCWVVAMGDHVGKTGFCEEQFLSLDPPEPTANLYRVQAGDSLGAIAERYYGKNFRGGNDARLYVQALYEANKGHKGVYLDEVDLGLADTWHRAGDEEKTLEIYMGAKVREAHAIWVPSEAFIQQLKAAGAITSGSSEISKAWRKAKEFVDDAIEAVKYAAGFIVGLLEGAWDAIVDLFEGAADLIEGVAKVVYHLVTGNPGAIKDMLMDWVDKLKEAWANRDKIADAFMQKWEAPDGWDRGRFQGEVLGWVMMTALITIVTAGEAAVPMIAGKWATVVRVLKTVDGLGDVTKYAGKVGSLSGKAVKAVKGKLGKAGDVAEDVVDAGSDAARHGEDAADAASDAAGKAGKAATRLAYKEAIDLGGETHHLKVWEKPDGRFELSLCSDCAVVKASIDDVLASAPMDGPGKALRGRLEKLSKRVAALEQGLADGTIKHTDAVKELNQIAAHLRDAYKKFPGHEGLCIFCTFKARLDYDALAKSLGFERTGARSHGQPVYRRGNEYISKDVDGHNGGVWKKATGSEANLRNNTTRDGTYNEDLSERVGP